MWYFSWILGLGLACTFSILNAMWLEIDGKE
ncbi:MAG: cytochrome bd-I oxidase subunit CydX [Pseudomonadota bacterium]|nr:cytochrome bd-I oxidase subunit CydX [Alphaproteobacteria bacterium]